MAVNSFTISSYADEVWDTFKYEFLAGFPQKDYISIKESYMVNTSMLDFCYEIQVQLRLLNCPVVIEGAHNGVIIIKSMNTNNHPIFITLQRDRTRTTNVGEDSIDCEITADPNVAQTLVKYLDDKYMADSPAKAYWWFMSKEGPTSISLNLKNKNKIYPEFYPWIDSDPEVYFADYMASDAPLLFLSGPPGTGKTSFLRYMVCKLKLSTYVGYDIKLFNNDEMFIAFITSEYVKLLVMEDAETLVLPRDKGGNNMMSRFLNVSDGLIKFPNKKIIFTTNESNFETIDQALVRPGRCYDFVEFRKLTPEECITATQVAGLDAPKDNKAHSIAELFNPKTRLKAGPMKAGF